MKFNDLYKYLLVAAVILTAAAGCTRDSSDPGKEFAPNMYLPVGYEPYKQEKANPINPMGLTMRLQLQVQLQVGIISLHSETRIP